MSSAALQPEELAPLKRAVIVTGQSKTYIYRHIGDKEDPFPAPIKIGGRSMWVLSELHAWVANKVASSRRMGERVGTPTLK